MTKTFLIDTSFLNDDEIFRQLYNQTSTYRQRKIDSFRFRKDKNLCLGAGALLNFALMEFGLSEKDMTYSFEKSGKPYFKNHKEIHFNISHSQKCAIVSVSDKDVGCDIELIAPQKLDIAEKFFHKNEYNYLQSLNNSDEQSYVFFRLWTLKESYVKALGKGMTKPFDEFSIEIGDKITIFDNQDENPHFFKEYQWDKYAIACCSRQDCFQKELIIVTPKDL